MKPAHSPAFALLAVCMLASLYAWAGPRPRGTLTASPTSVVTHDFSDLSGVLVQCPGGAAWYRTFTVAEYAAQDGGLQADGGVFGVLADFRNNTDPIAIQRAQGEVAFGLAAISDAGAVSCFLSIP